MNQLIKKIALTYKEEPLRAPEDHSSWKTLHQVNLQLFTEAKKDCQFTLSEKDPYKTYDQMLSDYQINKEIKIYTGNCTHPIWTRKENLIYRAVHDYYGHILSGYGFSIADEIRAYYEGLVRIPKIALSAYFSETMGQLCYYTMYKAWPSPQKAVQFTNIDFLKPGITPEA